MAQVVVANTIVDPWTMAAKISNLLGMAVERLTDHV
jgi:hypothetical protein